METELIFKIASVGIVVAILNVLLAKSGRDEYGLMVTIAGVVVVLAMVAEKVLALMTSLQTLFSV